MRTLFFTLVLSAAPAVAGTPGKLTVTSSAFPQNGAIPDEYTCHGDNKSPQLAWSGAPAAAKTVAIMVEDPDSPKGTVLHWLVTGIDASVNGVPRASTIPDGAAVAKNEKGDNAYMGPCPPDAPVHHYHFKVFALDSAIAKPASKADFLTSIKGHVLAEGELIGTYQKK